MGLSRVEFWARLGLLKEADPVTVDAYRFTALLDAQESSRGAAAENNWHVSFHGSQFPGDGKACGREAMYRMADLPRSPFDRRSQQIMDAGKDIEDRIVQRWYRAGSLLSNPPYKLNGEKKFQTVFEDHEHWLTSTVDAIVVPPRSLQPFVVEIKTKYAKDIESMRRLVRSPDDKHIKQIKCQIGLAHEAGPQTVLRCHNSGRMSVDHQLPNPIDEGETTIDVPLCPQHMSDSCLEEVELLPVKHGYIYYVSRDRPSDTREFYVGIDHKFMQAGRDRLADWREAFLEDVLPQENFVDKRYAHPFGWLWGDQPCKWCDYGTTCREDMKTSLRTQERVLLSDSYGVQEATERVLDYDFDSVRDAVLERWGIAPS